MTYARFSFPTDITFGSGSRHELAQGILDAGISSPLVVTDGGVAALPSFRDLVDDLTSRGLAIEVFSGVHGNPDVSQVEAGTEAFRSHGSDALVGVGGGAALDVAKAVGISVSHDAALLDHEDGRADAAPIGPIPWFAAVPTTAGTGSEVSRAAIITDETATKRILVSPQLLARKVYADPDLTLGLPAAITAATGMDALTHNVEAFLSDGYNPMCDGIALEGIRLCAGALTRAVEDGSDVEARSSMLMASMMGAVAFQKGLGPVHSCAHAIGTVYDLHHGLANALIIDEALRLDLPDAGPRLSRLAEVVGAGSTPDAFLDWLARLKASIGIPATLADVDLDAGRLDDLVEAATADPCHLDGPRTLEADDFREVFASVLAP